MGRFDQLLEYAGRDERAAARALTDARRALAVHDARLVELRLLRDDCLRRLRDLGRGSVAAGRLGAERAFLEQIEATIRQAADWRMEEETRCRELLESWRERHARVGALERLRERERRRERRERIRAERRNADAGARRAHARQGKSP